MRSKTLATVACGAFALALATLAFAYGRFLRAVEHAATEGGVIERPA
jgi:hypothetical protein